MAGIEESLQGSFFDRLPDRETVLNPAIILPTLAITLSEVFLYAGYTNFALWAHFLTLLGCVAAPLKFEDGLPMFQVFALLPIFRLVNLGMPIFIELTIYWFPLVYAPLFPAIYVVTRAPDTPSISFSPRLFAVALLPVAVLGALLASIEYTIIQPASLIPVWDVPNVLFISVIMLGFVGFVEELLYRGLLQRGLQARIGRWGGMLLSAFLFGMMHSAYNSVPEIAFAGGIGLLFGVIYDVTDSLMLVTVCHGVLNIFLFAVIPMHGPFLT